MFGFSDDTHEAIGLDDSQLTASKISELVEARITPHVRFEINEIPSDVY